MEQSNPKSSDQNQKASPKAAQPSQPETSGPQSAASNNPQPDTPRAEVPLVNVNIPDVVTQVVRDQAEAENLHRNLAQRLVDANRPKVVEHKTPPVPAGVQTQTNAELEAGRAMNKKFAAQEAERKALTAQRAAEQWEGKNTPVFRPDDFVPDQKKGQGNNGARTL